MPSRRPTPSLRLIDMATTLRRHDLAYLRDGADVSPAGDGPLAPWMRGWLLDWIARGKPLVVARQSSFAPATQPPVKLGAALPLRLGRAKISCRVACGVVRTASALSAEKVLGVLPDAERQALARLSDVAEKLGIALGVYGSTAWECLAGESYRRPDSDVDLICDVHRRDTLSPWLRAMQITEREMNGHLDGEIRFPNGEAVAWREFARVDPKNVDANVLVKSLYDVGFARIGALMESLQ
jgi:phosphoribosyl-dephospho-CoA transferase